VPGLVVRASLAASRQTPKELAVALLVLIAQTLVFITATVLLGQFLVGIFHWGRRHDNVMYQLFGVVARPVVRSVRAVTPRLVLDQHVPLVAFLLCVIAYFALGFAHRDVCARDLAQPSCEKWVQAWAK
jgi:uncharacterized protein YggT (Ycf19 family)